MNIGRKRPVILKETAPRCPHCEAMGWQFNSKNASGWADFLELCQWENVEELVFSLESVLYPDWEKFSSEAYEKGFQISVWLCGEQNHKDVEAESFYSKTKKCEHLYPLVADFSELYSLRDKWQLGLSPLVLAYHEEKLKTTLKLFEIEMKQDLFPVWGMFASRDVERKVGIEAKTLHELFFKTRGRAMRQGLSPLPGLEMLDVRFEKLSDLRPTEVSLQVGKEKPKFSFIIPAYGDLETLTPVMEHLLQLKGPSFDVVFVDEGNPSSLEAFFESYLSQGLQGTFLRLDWDQTEDEKIFRAGRARNLGAKYARGDFLCFLDSDILVGDNYLVEVEEGLKKYDLVQAIRLDLKTNETTLKTEAFNPLSPYWEKFRSSARKSWNMVKHPWKYICTHSLSISKASFIEAGGFSSLFNRYGYEDTEFGYRCYQSGKKFGLLETPVGHIERRSLQVNHKNSHRLRYSNLQFSGSLFMRNSWDQEVFTHCHYLFSARQEKLSRIRALGIDVVQSVKGRKLPFS